MADLPEGTPDPQDTQGPGRDWRVLDALIATIAERRAAGDADASYTARLFAKGRAKIAQKVGEEGLETALAAVGEGPDAVVSESADLLFHWLVLLAEMDVDPARVLDRLAERQGLSGLAEKAARSD
ncbi:phosphoribosyl-ATP diphosphatase [Rhodothalassium salexigens]|uniref:phosphoribosyl-ATP diphosphatase n=1 Tax=Rhodothalassium salexigens TaxID=1086 RepID=UPI001913404C|nr:phosphoribosyl-ATP diphosphatase [Rhodothalassium salexigens]MBK5910273.1 phosphoribosyl-ATP diphosphatase [Rhodothalassium salexigens]MBK5921366.1 phosphoribosyl-ATP diphosphatase [Rhodothalassium salexigens]